MCLKKTSKPPAEKPFRKASLKKAQEEEEDLLALERTQIPKQGSDWVPDLDSFNGEEGRHRSQPTEKTETVPT